LCAAAALALAATVALADVKQPQAATPSPSI
jgi:hypothetical protein